MTTSAGHLDQQDWRDVLFLAPRLIVFGGMALLLVRPLTVLALDDANARSLGLSLVAWRLGALACPNRPRRTAEAPGPNGRPLAYLDMTAVATRYYTIRRIDAAAGWVEIDFVLHEAPGPAGDFARFARPGDI
ncbi:iron chelate uptake ABC transporter family permease subunit [Bosea vestrisii]|uniref:iron chelate uptake ABC transporter family permease subunit n=1 Tax=Bosea vestrisii TaxID=151416 RepID=UPI0024E019B5|nr:iron chelate uptake ABC transporter family permease subunit [Bosea vestrisii]WID99544.1 iron chelate uptake ABC transporter family permease subunit [Bosea vestrisii]